MGFVMMNMNMQICTYINLNIEVSQWYVLLLIIGDMRNLERV
jgi:hypothetical protein